MISTQRRPNFTILFAISHHRFEEASANIRMFQLKCCAFANFNSKIITAPRRERKKGDNHRDFCEGFTEFVDFLSVSQILTRDSSMNLTNWPPKGLSWEVSFAPAITVSRYENGGPDTHVAKAEIADGFMQNHVFFIFSQNKIFKFV